jgi:hypothetical protein
MDLCKILCNDLLNLDRLWLKYSTGRFGFSVKCDIYDAEGCDYKSFCDRIGYRLKVYINSLPSKAVTFWCSQTIKLIFSFYL